MTKEELKKRRERLNFTQASFAEVVGLAANTVSRYETGLLEIPKWMELTMQSLERKHIEEMQKEVSGQNQ